MTAMHKIPMFMAAIVLGACEEPRQNISIPFEVRFDDSPMACGKMSGGLALTDLRFYVASVELRRTDGVSAPVDLAENGRWQSEDLALLDFEDGASGCQNGTHDRNTLVLGTVPAGDYQGLRFVLGVPFDLNHANPLTARPPLDESTMHWHWRSGYKFLRAGVETSDDGFWIHLGSAGCHGTVQNITSCSFPNRVDVLLTDFEPGDSVVVEFDALVAASDMSDATPSDCASGPAESSCVEPFAVFGLDHSNGDTISAQRFFRVRHR